MLNLGWGRKVPVMMQAEASECGLVSMAMISAFHGRHLDLADMRSRGLLSARGATLNDLAAVAAAEGFQTRGLRLEMDHLSPAPGTRHPALGPQPLRGAGEGRAAPGPHSRPGLGAAQAVL